MNDEPTDEKEAAAIEVITRAAESGDRVDPDLLALPATTSIQDAAKELGESDPTTCVQKGSKGDYTITPDNAREIGKACGEILASREQRRENENTRRNIGSALAGISQSPKSSPKKKMFVTNLPGISD